MTALFDWLVSHRTAAYMLTATLLLLGLSELSTIKRDVYPSVDLDEMSIVTTYPGASPEDVELNVTNKLEDALQEVDAIERIISFSMENISVVHLRLDSAAKDLRQIKNRVREAVARVSDLPSEVRDDPAVTEISTDQFPIMEVGVTGNAEYRVLREHARQLEDKLLALPGVARVIPYGYRAREIQVEVSPEATARYQVPVGEIVRAIQSRNIHASAGSFESYSNQQSIVTLAQFTEPQAVGDVIVRSSFEGARLYVRDLALIRDDFEVERMHSRINGQTAVSFNVVKKGAADIIRTVDSVHQLVEHEQQLLPDGVHLVYSADTARVVRNRLDVVVSNGIMGLGLVLAILFVFLDWRSAFWVAVGIPASLLGTLFVLPRFDAYLDSIALAAMIVVIGIIVDDAIIVAENISRHREFGKTPVEAAAAGIREVFLPVLTTIITTILAFGPLFFMSGMLGKFVFVIPLVVVIALVLSFIESVVALPAHLSAGRKSTKSTSEPPKRSRFTRTFKRPARRFAAGAVRFRYPVVLVFVLTLGSAVYFAVNHMDFVLFPGDAADEFHIQVELPAGASLDATSDKLQEIERIVKRLPGEELVSFTTRVGIKTPASGTLGYSGERSNHGIVTVYLTPYGNRARSADQIVEVLRQSTDHLNGMAQLTYYVEGGGPPVGRPITLRVVGGEDDARSELAQQIVSYLASIDGVTDIERDDEAVQGQFEVEIDYDRLARLGLTVGAVAQTLRIAYDGEVVTSTRYGDEDVDFRVILDKTTRSSSAELGSLRIANQQGRLIPLGEVAQFKASAGPTNLIHFDSDRAIAVTAGIETGTTTPVAVTREVLARFNLEKDWPGLRLAVGGEAQETEASMASLSLSFIFAAIGIYFVLTLLFDSFVQPLMVMSVIPFGFIGVIGAFAFHGQPLGFVAMVGIVGLAGVLVNDSLILVKFVNDLKRRRPTMPTQTVLASAVGSRLRPILITSITTVSGLLPMAYGLGGSDPIMAPMALAMGYGILLATPLTLLLLPCLLMIQHDVRSLLRRIFVKAGLTTIDEPDNVRRRQEPVVSIANKPRQAA